MHELVVSMNQKVPDIAFLHVFTVCRSRKKISSRTSSLIVNIFLFLRLRTYHKKRKYCNITWNPFTHKQKSMPLCYHAMQIRTTKYPPHTKYAHQNEEERRIHGLATPLRKFSNISPRPEFRHFKPVYDVSSITSSNNKLCSGAIYQYNPHTCLVSVVPCRDPGNISFAYVVKSFLLLWFLSVMIYQLESL